MRWRCTYCGRRFVTWLGAAIFHACPFDRPALSDAEWHEIIAGRASGKPTRVDA